MRGGSERVPESLERHHHGSTRTAGIANGDNTPVGLPAHGMDTTEEEVLGRPDVDGSTVAQQVGYAGVPPRLQLDLRVVGL